MSTDRAYRVLVNSHELRLSSAACTRHAGQRRLSSSIGVTERVERGTVQATNSRLPSSSRGLRGRGIVKTSNSLPTSSLGTLEYDWLAIMACCYQGVFRGPYESGVRKGRAFDSDGRGRARVNDRN